MVMQQTLRPAIRKPNSAGLVTTTAANDLCHTLGINRSGVIRTAVIRKILAYNDTGANETIQFGTLDLAAVPNFVQYLPDLVCVNGLENIWTEEDIPVVEFSPLVLAGVLGRTGNVYVLATAAAILVTLELDEFGS